MKKVTLILICLLPLIGFTQDTLVKWTFPNNPDDSIADGGTTSNLNMIISSQGGTNAVSYNSNGATTRCARATKWNSGNSTKFWQIKCHTTGYLALTLSSKQRSSSTGPRDFKVQVKEGYGGTWSDVTGGTVLNADNWTSGVLSNLALPANCNNIDTLYIRWIMTSDTSVVDSIVPNTGSSRIDDIVILGSVITSIPTYSEQNDVVLWQNASDITISIKEPFKEITMFDISGNLVFINRTPSLQTMISTGKLNRGLYFIKLLNASNTVVTKKVLLN